MKFDLHIHSNISDGNMSKLELLKLANDTQIKVIAFCDHNIYDNGVDILKEYESIYGKSSTLVIPGIELDASNPKIGGLHILGYGINNISFIQNKLNELEKENYNITKKQIKLVKEHCNDNNFELVEIHKLGDEKQKSREISKCYIHYLMGAISADGKVYPCNYHPKPNGYFYDSCVNKNFGDIWENLMQYDIDTKIPTICPKVCDPFKNRANKLLEVAHDIYKTKGIDYLKKCVQDIENM